MWYVKLNDTIKTLDFLRSHSKSPIVYENCYFQNLQNRTGWEVWFI